MKYIIDEISKKKFYYNTVIHGNWFGISRTVGHITKDNKVRVLNPTRANKEKLILALRELGEDI